MPEIFFFLLNCTNLKQEQQEGIISISTFILNQFKTGLKFAWRTSVYIFLSSEGGKVRNLSLVAAKRLYKSLASFSGGMTNAY